MNARRLVALLLVAVFCFSAFAGCASKPAEPAPAAQDTSSAKPAEAPGAEKTKITLWTTGSQNLSDMFNEQIKTYNAKPDAKATVELQFVMSGSGGTDLKNRIAAAYKAGNNKDNFDIIAENSTSLKGYVDLAGSEDLFVPLDFNKIPNFKDVKVVSSFDNDKIVPYRGTTVVLAYDSARVPEPPKTWDALTQWMKDNPGRFAYNPPGSGGAGGGFVNTAVYQHLPAEAALSNDPKWMEQWDKGFAYLTEIHPYMYQSGGGVMYPNKNQGTLDLLINKEVDIIPAWADQVLTNVSNGTLPETVKIYQLEDHPLNGTDVGLVMTSLGAQNDGCYDFINYMISPEAQKICLETIYAVPVINSAAIDSDAVSMISDIDVTNFKTIALGDLGEQLNKKWDSEIATLG